LAAVCRPNQPLAAAAAAAAAETAAHRGVKNLKLKLDSGTVFILERRSPKTPPSENFLFEFDTNFQFYDTHISMYITPGKMGTASCPPVGGAAPLVLPRQWERLPLSTAIGTLKNSARRHITRQKLNRPGKHRVNSAETRASQG
jgi:hypothetical protein